MKQLNISDIPSYRLGISYNNHTGYIHYVDEETHELRIDVYKNGECIERYRYELDEEFDRKIEELKNRKE